LQDNSIMMRNKLDRYISGFRTSVFGKDVPPIVVDQFHSSKGSRIATPWNARIMLPNSSMIQAGTRRSTAIVSDLSWRGLPGIGSFLRKRGGGEAWSRLYLCVYLRLCQPREIAECLCSIYERTCGSFM